MLKAHDDDLLRLVLQLTYTKSHQYSYDQVMAAPAEKLDGIDLVSALAFVSESLPRYNKEAGNSALHSLMISLEPGDQEVFAGVIKHNQYIGMNKSLINRAIPGLL